MKVFIMRHGEAVHYAPTDEQRALTEHGKENSIIVARACKQQGYERFDKVLVSLIYERNRRGLRSAKSSAVMTSSPLMTLRLTGRPRMWWSMSLRSLRLKA